MTEDGGPSFAADAATEDRRRTGKTVNFAVIGLPSTVSSAVFGRRSGALAPQGGQRVGTIPYTHSG